MTRRMYDQEVSDVFDTFGIGVAIYFEVIRYRQQLHEEGELFPLSVERIFKLTGLTYWQQYRAKKILNACEWIEVIQRRAKKGGTVNYFRVGETAKEALGNIRRPQIERLKALKKTFALAR